MATKTLILRPIAVTADDTSLVTFYPSDTGMSNAHTLVNEKIADEDSGYVYNSLGAKVYYHFNYIRPSDLLNITNIAFALRLKLESGTSVGSSITVYYDSSSLPANFSNSGASTSSYASIPLTFNTTSLPILIEFIDSITSNTTLRLCHAIGTDSKKANPIRTTQVYMEITYEAKEPDAISIKKDEIWTEINYTSVYKKIDNAWKLSNTSILQSNQKYTIKEAE